LWYSLMEVERVAVCLVSNLYHFCAKLLSFSLPLSLCIFLFSFSEQIELDRKGFLASVLAALPADLAKWRQVWRFSFAGEPAIDAGGVAREFWSLLSEHLFGRASGLFM